MLLFLLLSLLMRQLPLVLHNENVLLFNQAGEKAQCCGKCNCPCGATMTATELICSPSLTSSSALDTLTVVKTRVRYKLSLPYPCFLFVLFFLRFSFFLMKNSHDNETFNNRNFILFFFSPFCFCFPGCGANFRVIPVVP
jgi:hypothetical protein